MENLIFESHETALCVIPPRELWSSVDALRGLYDKAYTAWPPHINLAYPFVRPEVLEDAAQILQGFTTENSLQLVLDVADNFKHKHHNTIFLGSNPDSGAAELSKLRDRVSDAFGQLQGAGNESFIPHMTIGQSEDPEAAPHHFLLEKARLLTPLEWKVKELAILVRDDVSAQGASGPRPMRLWGTFQLDSGTFTRSTPPQSFDDRLDEISAITFQPSYHMSQPLGPWERALLTTYTPEPSELVLDRLVVASYNVLAEFEWPPRSNRHPALLQNLLSARASADIVVLQEVTDHFLPNLLASEEIRSRYPFVSAGPPDQAGIGPLPSLLNTVVLSKFPFEWHYLPFQRKHKGCTVVRFSNIGTLAANDGKFRHWVLMACHLSQGLADGAIATKKKEVQKMLDYLSTTFPQHPCIVAGDFNLVTSSYTVEAARKRQDISQQTVHRLGDIDRALSDAGFLDTWLATRLESGESSDIANDKRNVLDSFQGEQGATFDPLTNSLTAELVGSGLNNRPQRYDKILVKADGQYHPHGFNMFGQTPLEIPDRTGLSYASDHWGIRCLLLKSTTAETSKSCVPSVPIKLQRPVPALANGEDLEQFLQSHGSLPTEQERDARADAIKTLENVLKDVASVPEGESRYGPDFVVVPVGSYGLGVWTSSSDLDILCIGSFSSKTFFTMAIQRLKRVSAAGISILRRVKANSGYMLELEVQGIKVDLQYCAAASIVER
jgi:2'-5' RNA ligase/endonuclease/exonuclease/phosphatase family metal-dependent hydrolase